MSQSALNAAKRLIPQLSPSEKQQLIALLKAATSIHGGAKIDSDKVVEATDDYLTDSIKRYLLKKGLVTRSTANMVMRRTIERLPNYPQDNATIRQWLADHLGKLTAVEEMKIGAVTAEALDIYLKHIKFYQEHGVGAHELLSNIHRVPSAIETSFPGYAASGLLKLILTAREPEWMAVKPRKRSRSRLTGTQSS